MRNFIYFFLLFFEFFLIFQSKCLSFFDFFVISMDTVFYYFLKFWLKKYSGKSYKERSSHKSIDHRQNFTSIRHRNHISISYSCHSYCSKIERMEKIPTFNKMKTNSTYKYNKNNNRAKKKEGMIGEHMVDKFPKCSHDDNQIK